MFKDVFSLEDRERTAEEISRGYKTLELAAIVACSITFFSVILNIIDSDYTLMIIGISFMILTLVVYYLARKKRHYYFARVVFAISFAVVFTYVIVNGASGGFNIVWLLIMPSSFFLVFGKTYGIILNLFFLFELLFFFFTQFGRSLLLFSYEGHFVKTFPFVFLATFLYTLYHELQRGKVIRELKEANRVAVYNSNHDSLTGLYNRYGFNKKLDAFIKEAIRTDGCFCFMIIDIDDFKKVNDVYGHFVGDEVLKYIANKIDMAAREKNGTACRWGGEEFAIFVARDTAGDVKNCIAKKLMEDLSVPYIDKENGEIFCTVSIGKISTQCLTYQNISKIVTKADDCLYKAKKEGKNKIVFEEYIEE